MTDSSSIPWHAKDTSFIFEALTTREAGLTAAQVKARLQHYGRNSIPHKTRETIPRILWRQIHHPVMYALLFATALAFFFGTKEDAPYIILSVVVLNGLIGFFQEYKAHRAIRALSAMVPKRAIVIREGKTSSIYASELVPGDIVRLEAGDLIPADIRLISVKNFQCDESSLTGESHPAHKKVEPDPEEALLADRKSCAYNGTYVVAGSALGVVVATGIHTEFGKISDLLGHIPFIEPPLSITMKKMVSLLTYGIIFLGFALFLIGYLRGDEIRDSGLSAIALAVACIPEGLPAIITISASIGVLRMARRNAIIRQLPAVETLGSTNIICTDKTGTLTYNEMIVEQIWTPRGDDVGRLHLLTAAIISSDASLDVQPHGLVPIGDPTEIALVVAGQKAGLNEKALRAAWKREDVIPFESERRMMATLTLHEQKQAIFLKGAPEEILARCSLEHNAEILSKVEEMARAGMRVLAIATKKVQSPLHELLDKEIASGCSLLGIVGMKDPPRKEVQHALKACHEAGITVKMISGDHLATAEAIGRELGLLKTGNAISGAALNQFTQEEWHTAALSNHVFARTNPQHKLKLVETLQGAGMVVAMTGDGVNDAPALKRADIGIAMGIKGTAVAKEAADMILADDNFATIEAAVEEGRRVYDNLIKAFAFILPTSLAQGLVIFFSVLFFPIHNGSITHPILPVQILWINLVVAVALSLPLAFEAMEANIMRRAPRKKNAPLFTPSLQIKTAVVSLFMALSTIALFMGKYRFEIWEGTPVGLAAARAQTMAVTAMIFLQIFYLFSCRTLRESKIRPRFFSNPAIFLGIAGVVMAQIAFVHLPFMNTFFRSAPLAYGDWVLSALLSLLLIPMTRLENWVWKFFREPSV